MIHKTDNGSFVASSKGGWIPGCFESERAARYAFRFTNEQLQKLQNEKNKTSGVITFKDLQELNQKPMSKKKTRHSAKDGKFVSKEFAEANPDEVVEVTNHDHKTEMEKFRSWTIENGKDINSETVVSEYLTEK